MTDTSYHATIQAWRQRMEDSLRAGDGWLAVAGLFWLHEGHNTAGADPSCDIALPEGSAPAHVGNFELRAGRVTFHAVDGAEVAINGELAPSMPVPLRSDEGGRPDMITLGSLTLFVINRGQRYGIRLRDTERPARRAFEGRQWFPIDESLQVEARFVPYDPPKPVLIPNILGDVEEGLSPGYVTFTLDGQEHRLEASPSTGPGLFFVFRDETTGVSTYPTGRFLRAARPEDGFITLDFNQAYNPPCAFTPYATCPLPPPQNSIPRAIEAGERWSGEHA